MRRLILTLLLLGWLVPSTYSAGSDFLSLWHDPLAQRDEDGLLHQSPTLNPTDLAPRYPLRCSYYLMSGLQLEADPGYVGALQVTLRRLGYYCGPIDGVYSPAVSSAVAHMQKNYSQRVTGTLTLQVRHALHLP